MTEAPTKYFFRQRQQNRLFDAVVKALESASEKSGVRRKDIAKALGIQPSQVTRLLSGPANWTSDTVSDLLFAINAEMEFKVVAFKDRLATRGDSASEASIETERETAPAGRLRVRFSEAGASPFPPPALPPIASKVPSGQSPATVPGKRRRRAMAG